MSSTGPVNATPAAPLWVDIPEPVVTVDRATPDYPVDLLIGVTGERYGFTPEEALDLAVRLVNAANTARESGRG